jgi:iron complex outermembrane recepter protein
MLQISPVATRRILFSTTLMTALICGQAFAQTVATNQQPAAQTPAADDTTDVDAGKTQVIIVRAERARAAARSAFKASLDQGQPQSIISRPFIELATPETGDYTNIAAITPSASSAGAPNGSGYGEAKLTIRGFSDAQYNVTFDGIPWGDTNGPSHHSNSFFPASTIGAIIVERGPGRAGDLGQVSYGGNVKMYSNKVAGESGLTLRQTFGSWNSWQSVAVWQTGTLENLGGISGFVNIQGNKSDGQQTYSGMHSTNATVKFRFPLADDWNLTAFATANHNKWHQSDNPGGTPAQVALYGVNFNLSNDPTKATYYGYNTFRKDTDFGYLRMDGALPWGFKVDSTLYTYYYNNNTDTGRDLASVDGITNAPGTLGAYVTNAVALGATRPSNPTDLLGYNKLNSYRNFGSITNFTREFDFGTLTIGAWFEKSETDRHTYDYSITANYAPDNRQRRVCLAYTGTVCTTLSSDNALNAIAYEEHSSWRQAQYFADLEWNVTDSLTVTPGIKTLKFTRRVAAPVIASPRKAQYAEDTFTKTLPFITANYKILPTLSVYAQYAQGFLVPSLNSLYVINPSANTAEPSESTNYQVGTVYQSGHWAIDLDFYKIDASNLLAADSTGQAYINIGKAKYDGVEGQVSYSFSNGFTVFANHSVNNGVNAITKQSLASVPESTTGAGILFSSPTFSGSLLYKEVGSQFSTVTETLPVDAYDTIDASLGYTFGKYQIKAQVSNISDNRAQATFRANANPALNRSTYLPGRNVQVTLIARY